MAGGAAGAFWGHDALPARRLAALYRRQEVEEIAQRPAMLRAA